jgi:hypothetical protein
VVFKRKKFMPVKWVILIAVGAIFAFLVGIFHLLGNSEPAKAALHRAQSNPQLVERLGQPIQQGLIVSGNIQYNGPSGHAELSIPISGPKGKGTLYSISNRRMGVWEFEALRFAADGQHARLDLLASTAPTAPAQ